MENIQWPGFMGKKSAETVCFLNRTAVKCVFMHCEATAANVETRKCKSEFN
jgi:hypothetical protein